MAAFEAVQQQCCTHVCVCLLAAVLRRTLVPTQHLVHKLQNTHDKDNNQGFLSPLTVRWLCFSPSGCFSLKTEQAAAGSKQRGGFQGVHPPACDSEPVVALMFVRQGRVRGMPHQQCWTPQTV